MRKTLVLLLGLLVAASGFAQLFDPFAPPTAQTFGQGGSYTADSEGFNAFFFNPAGFAKGGELTLLSTNAWLFADRQLTDYVLQTALGASGSGGEARSVSEDDILAALADLGVEGDDAAVLAGEAVALADWYETLDETQQADLATELQNDDTIGNLISDETIAGLSSSDPDVQAAAAAELGASLAVAVLTDPEAFETSLNTAAANAGASAPPPIDEDAITSAVAASFPGGTVRVGVLTGAGWTGRGLGFGAFLNGETIAAGDNLLRTTGLFFNTVTLVGGIGLNFNRLAVGASVRPTLIGYSFVDPRTLVTSAISGGTPDVNAIFGQGVYFGQGIAIDAGAIYRLGGLSLGVSARNLFGTRYAIQLTDQESYFGAFPTGPETGETVAEDDPNYLETPMTVNVGASWNPDFGAFSILFDPTFSADILDLGAFLREADAAPAGLERDDLADLISVGAELRVLRFMKARVGWNGGFLTAGAGIRLLFLDVNVAVGARDFNPEDPNALFSTAGATLEAAIRF